MSLRSPAEVMERLDAIEVDLADRQVELEDAAWKWHTAKRDREKHRAETFLLAEGTVAERSAVAEKESATDGRDEEARYESLKAVVRTLETRASIGQSILRSQARAA